MRFIKYSIFLISILSIHHMLLAQDDRTASAKFGIFFQKGNNVHFADFGSLDGIRTCCNKFEDGSGDGNAFGFSYDYNVSHTIMIGLRATFIDLSGNFKAHENITIIYPDRFVNGRIDYKYDADISAFGISPRFTWNFFDNFQLSFGTGLYFLTNAEYTHDETIYSPYAHKPTFIDSSDHFNNHSGDIDDASSTIIFTEAGLAYDIYIPNSNFLITPEIQFSMGLTPVANGIDWNVGNIRMGVNAQYVIPGTQVQLIPLSAFLNIKAINENKNDKEIIIHEYTVKRSLPLLNYIFFDKGESEIPERYNLLSYEDARQFIEEDANTKNALTAYYDVLNIIGRRMTAMPNAVINLVGCNSSGQTQIEDLALSKKRTDRIFEYLTNIWQIEANRINIELRNAPKASISPDKNYGADIDIDDAILENDRVEITSNTWSILAPLMTDDKNEEIVSKGLEINPTVSDSSGIKDYEITLSQDDQLIDKYVGLEVPITINLPINNYEFIDLTKPITYVLTLNPNESFKQAKLSGELQPSFKTIPRQKINFSIIWNEHENYKIDKSNQQLLKLLKTNIEPGTIVTIDSYTDKLGFKNSNKSRSEYRAKNVIKLLDLKNPAINIHGESKPIYDETLPEARIYNRTVNIVVESPENEND
jgi:outer membrane protein OmpA-like peptidoglycan-associated protein